MSRRDRPVRYKPPEQKFRVSPRRHKIWWREGATVAGAAERSYNSTFAETLSRAYFRRLALFDPAMPVIETHDLTKVYGNSVQVSALRGVDLEVARGEFLAIMGPSGSGKSTLLHLLGGIEAPSGGQVLLEGRDLAGLDDDERTLMRRRRIGFIFQSFNLLPSLTSMENVAMPLLLDGRDPREADERAAALLDRVGVGHRKDHLPSQMSGGEQQRVAIARALVIEPAVLLADEPTGNLDSAMSEQVVALLQQLVEEQQQTIVMVTHEPEVAAEARRVIHFRDGLIERDESVERRARPDATPKHEG
jgi:putative ABC transport system ATP-binding protein